jgi:hypothetical protein
MAHWQVMVESIEYAGILCFLLIALDALTLAAQNADLRHLLITTHQILTVLAIARSVAFGPTTNRHRLAWRGRRPCCCARPRALREQLTVVAVFNGWAVPCHSASAYGPLILLLDRSRGTGMMLPDFTRECLGEEPGKRRYANNDDGRTKEQA